MTTARASRPVAAALAAALTLACSVAPAPPERTDVTVAAPLARQAAAILLQLAAYDYALVGALNGQVDRVASAERYALVTRGTVRAIRALAGETVAASADRSGPIRDRLLALVDGVTTLGNDVTAYAEGGNSAAFSRVIAGVSSGWERLTDLAALLPRDEALLATIARGTSFSVTVTTTRQFTVSVGPYAALAEAEAAARRVGQVESITRTAPFMVRVGTFPDRAAAAAAAAALVPKGFSTAAIVDEERHAFARGAAAPDVELWREPARIFDTHGAARRVALSPDGAWLATGSDDGTVAIFSGAGVLRALPRFNAGVAHVLFSENGEWLFAGGLTLATLRVPSGVANGTTVRMPTPATQVVFVPAARAFVAASRGLAGRAGAIAARAPDGALLAAPFPLGTPASGAVLAASPAGELFIATAGSAGSDVEVLRIGAERAPRGVVRVPGAIRQLELDPTGSLVAALTDQGVMTFDRRAADPEKTLATVAPAAARAIAFGPDGLLYVLEAARLVALDRAGAFRWAVPLTDGRRLMMARRAIVLDGSERLIAVDGTGVADELGAGGQVQDIAVTPDGQRVAALVDGRRAVLFTLP